MKVQRKVLTMSFLFSGFLWLLGGILDSTIFYNLNFIEALITRVPANEITVRSIGIAITLIFGYIANLIVNDKQKLIHKLEISQENLSITLNSIGDAVLVTDVNGLITQLNPVAEHLTGWNNSEARGRHVNEVFNIVNEITRQRAVNPVDKVLSEGCIVGLANHTALIAKDGREFSIADSGAPIKESSGKIIGCILVFRDVTDERDTNQKIKDSEEKYSSIFSMCPDAIAITRYSDGAIIEMNDSFATIFGFEKASISGRSTSDLKVWNEASDRQKFLDALNKDGRAKDLEIELHKGDGKTFTVNVSATIIDSNGEKAILSYCKDITERKNYENRLIEYQSELEKGIKDRTIELEQINENLKNEIFERSRIETALRESEEKHRTLIDQLPVGVYRTTPEGRILQANPALAQILGFSSVEELMNASAFSFYQTPMNRINVLEKMKNTQELVQEEIELIRKDNKKIAVRDLGKLKYKGIGSGSQAIENVDNGINDTVPGIKKNEIKELLEIEYIDGILIDITESKKAKQALENSEKRYRQIFDNLNDIYFNLSEKGEILVVSPSITKTLDYSQDELVGQNINELINNPEISERFLFMIKRLGRINNFLLPVNKKDGTTSYLSANVRLNVGSDGTVVGVEGIARDITNDIRHKKVTSALYSISKAVNSTESIQELYSSIRASLGEIVDTSNFFIAISDRKKGTISFPYFVDEVDDYADDIDINSQNSMTAEVIRTGKPIFMDNKALRERYKTSKLIGSPSKIWLAVPLKAGDEVIGAMALQSYSNPYLYSADDVALLQSVSDQVAVAIDRKRALVALNFQLNFLQSLIDTIPNPIYYKDNDLRYVAVNKAFEEFAGLKKENIIGKSIFDIYTYDQASIINQMDMALLLEGNTQVVETLEKNHLGIERNILYYKSCFRDEKDLIAGIVGIKIDITDRKKAEEETKNALAKEHELNELKSRFIAMVSHEYRTPLTAIILSTELLSDYGDRLSEDNKQKHFQRIRQSVQTMNSLLDDIILYNKIDVGKSEFNPQYVDLEQVCLSLTHEMQFIAKDKCIIDLTINNGNVVAFVDEKIIRQVLVNLLSNAIKYSHDDSVIEFDVNVSHTHVDFRIKDSGIGIPEEEQARLFEPFFRGRNIGTISGTGLGLSIVKNSVDAHKGTVSYESKEGVGTTFFIRIPFLKENIEKVLSEAPQQAEDA